MTKESLNGMSTNLPNLVSINSVHKNNLRIYLLFYFVSNILFHFSKLDLTVMNVVLFSNIIHLCIFIWRNIEEILAAKGETVKRIEGSAALEIVTNESMNDDTPSGDNPGDIIKWQ